MPTMRDQLIRKALLALDEVVEQAGQGPVAPSFLLRFTLAYLYSCGDGTRWPFDKFWTDMQQPVLPEVDARDYGPQVRYAYLEIIPRLGLKLDSDLLQSLIDERARHTPEAIAQRRLAKAIREEEALRREG